MTPKIYDFLRYRKFALTLSLFFFLLTTASFITRGLNIGVDFLGGTVLEVRNKETLHPKNIRSFFAERGFRSYLQVDGNDSVRIQLNSKHGCADNCIDHLKQDFLSIHPNSTILSTEFIGPKASADLIINTILSITVAIVIMAGYVAVRFNWRFSLASAIALLQNIFFTMGFFVLSQYEFNITSLAAILTIIGYSINDSVVIFDKIRTNARQGLNIISPELINASINDTLSRTMMTLLTTMAACVTLWSYGGESLESFSGATTFGIAFGTYSSIFTVLNVLLCFKGSHVF